MTDLLPLVWHYLSCVFKVLREKTKTEIDEISNKGCWRQHLSETTFVSNHLIELCPFVLEGLKSYLHMYVICSEINWYLISG